jgi:hypothetical protein
MDGTHVSARTDDGDFGSEARVEVSIGGFVYELMVAYGGRDEHTVYLSREKDGVTANLYLERS